MIAPTLAVAAAGADTSKNGGALSTLGNNFSDFLKLLMTQLQNQDPTAPLDTNQFTSQLVQFSGVEQQINTNSSLTKLIELTQGGGVLQASAMVGKSVEVTSDRIALQSGKGAVQFSTTAAQDVSIGIYSDAGVKLRDAVVTTQPGRNDWAWDGKDNQGATLPDGAYRTIVTSQTGVSGQTGTSGQTDAATAAIPFTVVATATGVQKSGSLLQLQLGPLKVDMSAVQSVGP